MGCSQNMMPQWGNTNIPPKLQVRSAVVALVHRAASPRLAPTMRGNSERKAMAKALASAKSSKKSAAKKAAKPWNASWAACGDGCLDKLVVSVKKEPPITRPLRGGLVEFPAVPAAASGAGGAAPLVPLVLLGVPARP